MPATSLQKVGTGATKDWKQYILKNWAGKHLATNYVDWHQVSNMISYKINVLESLSEVNMGWSSPICERVRKKIVEYFKSNVPSTSNCKACQSHHIQCITSSKDSEKLEKISLRKGQGPKTFVGCLWSSALRRHCNTHWHDSVIDITKWAQEYFQKPLFQSGKVFYGQTSPNLTFLLEITDAVSSLKGRGTFVISIQFKSQHLWWCGGA